MSILKIVSMREIAGLGNNLSRQSQGFAQYCVSANGRLLAGLTTQGGRQTIQIWDRQTDKCIHTIPLKAPFGSIFFRFDPNNRYLIYSVGTAIRKLSIEPQYSTRSTETLYGPVLSQVGPSYYHDGYFQYYRSSATFSPDGRHLATGGPDGLIRIWDAETGTQTGPGLHGLFNIDTLGYSPDGKLVAAASGLNARIWNTDTSEPVGPVLAMKRATWFSNIMGLKFSPDGQYLVAISTNKCIYVWNLSKLQTDARVLTGHGNEVRGITFIANGILATGGWDKQVRFWNLKTGKSALSSIKTKEAVTALAVSSDGKRLFIATRGNIEVWNVGGKKPAKVQTLGHGEYWSIAMSPDNCRLAASAGGDLVVWDLTLQRPRELRRNGAHKKEVSQLEFSPDGTTLLSASDDSTVKMWRVESGSEGLSITPRGWSSAGTYPDRWAAKRSPDPLEWHIDFASRRELSSLRASAIQPVGSGAQFAVSQANQVLLFDADKATGGRVLVNTSSMGAQGLTRFSVSPNLAQIVTADDAGIVRFWDFKTGRAQGAPGFASTQPITFLSFNSTSTRVAVGSGGNIQVWDSISQTPIGNPVKAGKRLNVMGFHPKDDQIVSASEKSKEIRFWGVSPLQQVRKLTVPAKYGPSRISFSSSGRFFAAGVNSEIWVWQWETLHVQSKLTPFNDILLKSHAISPDDAVVATTDYSGRTRIWDIADGRPKGRYLADGPVKSLSDRDWSKDQIAFTGDGHHLVVSSDRDPVRIWDGLHNQPVNPFARDEVTEYRPAAITGFATGEDEYFIEVSDGKTVTAVSSCGTGKFVAYAYQSGSSTRVTTGIVVVSLDRRSIVEGKSGSNLADDFSKLSCLRAGSSEGSFIYGTWDGRVEEVGQRDVPGIASNFASAFSYTQSGPVIDIAASPDPQYIASYSSIGRVTIFNRSTRTPVEVLGKKLKNGRLEWVANGTRLVLTNDSETISIWEK